MVEMNHIFLRGFLFGFGSWFGDDDDDGFGVGICVHVSVRAIRM